MATRISEEYLKRNLEVLEKGISEGKDITISHKGKRVEKIKELEGLELEELIGGGSLAVSINSKPLEVKHSAYGSRWYYAVQGKIGLICIGPSLGTRTPEYNLLSLLGEAYSVSRCTDI